MKNFDKFRGGAGFGVAANDPLAGSAGDMPVLHNFFLNNSGGTPDFTGTLEIDSSRLVPDTFISFDSGFITSLSIAIFDTVFTLTDADFPSRDGVITNADGDLFSFHDNIYFPMTAEVSFGVLQPTGTLIIRDGNQSWAFGTLRSQVIVNGPSHSFAKVSVPVTGL